ELAQRRPTLLDHDVLLAFGEVKAETDARDLADFKRAAYCFAGERFQRASELNLAAAGLYFVLTLHADRAKSDVYGFIAVRDDANFRAVRIGQFASRPMNAMNQILPFVGIRYLKDFFS